MKKYIILFTTLMISLSISSCKKFVKEELVSTLTQDYYTTDQGLEDLVKSAYERVRFKFEGEQSYALFNFGTDEFIEGDQYNYEYYNSYSSALSSAEGLLNNLWVQDYLGIARCNTGLEQLPLYKSATSKLLGTPEQITQRMAELHFLRGYYYFQLVQQFGGVPLVLSPIKSKVTDFPRASVPDIYKQIINDLRYADEHLSASTTEPGRARKGAADHFLAKVYLTRGSAVTDVRGQQPTDIDSAAYYADLVINDKANYDLEPDYMNLWNGVYPAKYPQVETPALGQNGTPPSGDYSKFQNAQASKEIIFAAQFTNDPISNGSPGNRTHEYYLMQYDVGIPGLLRNPDNFNGRPYRRLGPSDYTIDLFDRKNDSRFYKSFRTVYYRNATDAQDKTVPVFSAADAPDPSLIGVKKYGVGDTAALFIVNDKNNPLTTAQLAKYRYKVYARYYTTTPGGPVLQGFNNNKYLTLVKMLDPVRVTNSYNEERGVRNGILARLGETYLIAAEAYGRLGNYTKALEYVNVIRQRAAYHLNEFRNPQTWMFDGGTKGDVSDTYDNLKATETLFSTNAPSENYPPSATTEASRFIHFMLNERTRELCGEFYRWEDLVRTETLYERTKLFNKDAVNIDPKDKLRPIPQTQINATTVNGQPMTPAQKADYQNPGW
jgi:hypothetical protein